MCEYVASIYNRFHVRTKNRLETRMLRATLLLSFSIEKRLLKVRLIFLTRFLPYAD
jgi:hypothetical protein